MSSADDEAPTADPDVAVKALRTPPPAIDIDCHGPQAAAMPSPQPATLQLISPTRKKVKRGKSWLPLSLSHKNSVERFEAWTDSPHLDRTTTGALSHGFGSRFVMKETNPCRRIWGVVVAILLLYTGTVFPYKLAFVEFHIGEIGENLEDPGDAWSVVETLVDILFWIDLVVIFFFSFKDEKSHGEICDLKLIAIRYLKGFFLINFIACVPPMWFKALFGGENDAGLNKGLRLSRLHRTSRLARLARLGRLAKLAPFLRESTMWNYIQAFRGVRMFNLAVGLFWVVHLMGCGWYLCASLHDSPEETWVGRRAINLAGDLLITQGPEIQWVHATYFVLTIFTTVGFGDMSALTPGEMVYVNVVMIVGTVVNSIIMSEVITTLTGVDRAQAELNKRFSLIQDFGEHTQLPPRITVALEKAVQRTSLHSFNKVNASDMKVFFSGNNLPRQLLGLLPSELFRGRLVSNAFLRQVAQGEGLNTPPRLPLMLGASVQLKRFEFQEVVYQNTDQPVQMFLVLEGTFAFVGVPSSEGGKPPFAAGAVNTALSLGRQKSIWKRFEEEDYLTDKQPLFPYMLFGRGSYFGEFEPLSHVGIRLAYARVESERGATALFLPKEELLQFSSEYPAFGAAWIKIARRKEWHRRQLLQRLTTERSYKQLAVHTIQTFCRQRFKKKEQLQIGEKKPKAQVVKPEEDEKQEGLQRREEQEPANPPANPSEIGKLRSHVEALDSRLLHVQSSMDLLIQELRASRREGLPPMHIT